MPPDRVVGTAAPSALAGRHWLTGTTPGESGEVPAKSSSAPPAAGPSADANLGTPCLDRTPCLEEI
jgi:hypothetical protein